MDVQANSVKTWTSSTRYKSEQAFISDWQIKILDNGHSTQRRYLEPCSFLAAPQLPIIVRLHLVKSAMVNEFGEGCSLCQLAVLTPL